MLSSLLLSTLLGVAAPAPDTKPTAEELEALKALRIKGFLILGSQFTDGSQTIGLSYLRSDNPDLTEQDMDLIGKLPRLRKLRLAGAPVSDTTLDTIAKLAKLHNLYLSGTKVTDEGLKKLSSLKNLKVLTLRGTPLTNRGLTILAEYPSLIYLDVDNDNITDEWLKALGENNRLEFLSLNGCKAVTEAGLAHLGKMANLSSLSLVNTAITEKGLQAMTKAGSFSHLNSMSLYGMAVTEKGLAILRNPQVLPALKSITLGPNSFVGAKYIEELKEKRAGFTIDFVR